MNVQLIAEITEGSNVRLNDSMPLPNWVAEYLLNDAV
jgi:hypothetical protein